MFVSYFKRSSYGGATSFLNTFVQPGPEGRRHPLSRYESLITVRKEGKFAVANIANTREEADYDKIKPVMEWFKERKDHFIRNLALVLEEQKIQDMQEMEFPG